MNIMYVHVYVHLHTFVNLAPKNIVNSEHTTSAFSNRAVCVCVFNIVCITSAMVVRQAVIKYDVNVSLWSVILSHCLFIDISKKNSGMIMVGKYWKWMNVNRPTHTVVYTWNCFKKISVYFLYNILKNPFHIKSLPKQILKQLHQLLK